MKLGCHRMCSMGLPRCTHPGDTGHGLELCPHTECMEAGPGASGDPEPHEHEAEEGA